MEDVLKLFKKEEDVLKALDNFCENEYNHEPRGIKSYLQEAIEYSLYIPIAYTTWQENENFDVEVYFDIANLALRKCLIGNDGLTYTESEWYDSIQEAIDSIEMYEFDSLTVFEEDEIWLISKLS